MADDEYPILGTEDVDAGFPDIDVGPVVKAFPDIDVGGTIRLDRAALVETHAAGDEFAVVILPGQGSGGLRLARGSDAAHPDHLDDLVLDGDAVGALGCRVVDVEPRTLLIHVTEVRGLGVPDDAGDHGV